MTVASGSESVRPSRKEGVGTKTPQCALLKAFWEQQQQQNASQFAHCSNLQGWSSFL